MKLKAPFQYFGGKSLAASLVWERFGDVKNYVEPFAGSLAVLLARPTSPHVETVNDIDGHIANFWRAVKHDHEAVASYCDWPVNEVDLHAKHLWLVNNPPDVARMMADPELFDAKKAGWWCWGLCSWIGSGWCSGNGPWLAGDDGRFAKVVNAGHGVNRQLPNLGNAGNGVNTGADVSAWLNALSDRLRRVRVCCGDWSRVVGNSVVGFGGARPCGVFLDPPYASKRCSVYTNDSFDVAHDVRAWAIEHGDDPNLRIALCGYEGEHEMPGWECVPWKAHGGYGSTEEARANSGKERIWFSPHCLKVGKGLFE